jgi:hypothetical protein
VIPSIPIGNLDPGYARLPFFATYPKLCRRLVLAATAPGFTMVPASPAVLWKMATPRRYTDKDYMNRIAADIYGGAFRHDPSLVGGHAAAMHGARNLGYLYQLLATEISNWSGGRDPRTLAAGYRQRSEPRRHREAP